MSADFIINEGVHNRDWTIVRRRTLGNWETLDSKRSWL